jgi:sugar lactone lactonase YvrE
LAGNPYFVGSNDGTGSTALFKNPSSVAVVATGTLFVADTFNHTIRKVTPAGNVTTYAGIPGLFGSADGPSMTATFNQPYGVAVDATGNVFVADSGNQTIRKISPGGVVTTFAGTAGLRGSADGVGAAANFKAPWGLAVDGFGNVHVADAGDNTIRKITPRGAVSTLAGTAGVAGSTDAVGAAASFSCPNGVALDAEGNLHITDSQNYILRKITPVGAVTTYAGQYSNKGYANGTASTALFEMLRGVAVDGAGVVYITDYGTIREIAP